MKIYFDESLSPAQKEEAQENHWQAFSGEPEGMVLTQYKNQLAIKDLSEPNFNPLSIDFLEPLWLKRFQKVHNETQLIKRAIGLPPSESVFVWDATAGLGRDAMVLASIGYRVTSVERSPLIYALLKDAYMRASQSDELKEILNRLKFVFGDSKILLSQLSEDEKPEIIYLDPMYPASKKSAQPRKEMQILRKVLGPDENLMELLEISKRVALKKVIIKNSPRADLELKPKYSVEAKSVRFDIF